MKSIKIVKEFFIELITKLAATAVVLFVTLLTIYLVSRVSREAGAALLLLALAMGKTLILSLPRILLLSFDFGSNKNAKNAEKREKASTSKDDEVQAGVEKSTSPSPIISEKNCLLYDELFR